MGVGLSLALSDYIIQVRNLVGDAGAVDWSNTEITNYVNNARLSCALDMHCVAVFNPNLQFIQGVESYNINGAVGGAVITAGGANYALTDTVTFSAPQTPGGITATGTPTIAAGVVTGITMTAWGNGYTAVPTITFNTATGSGAAATPATLIGAFNVLWMNNIWNAQRYQMNYRAMQLYNAYFRAIQPFQGRPGAWTIDERMLTVYIRLIPDQSYTTEWRTLAVPTPLVNTTDLDTQVLMPWADAVQYYAASLALMKLQNFAQSDKMLQLYERRVPRVLTGAGGVRIPNPYNRTFQRRVARV